MPRRHADRQRIAVSVPPALPGRLRQLLDLGRRQMLTRANIGIFRPPDALAVFNYCPQNVVRGCSQRTSPSADDPVVFREFGGVALRIGPENIGEQRLQRLVVFKLDLDLSEKCFGSYARGALVFCDQCGHCRRHTDGRTTATDAIESVANLVEKSFPTMDITGSITHHLGAKLVEAWSSALIGLA